MSPSDFNRTLIVEESNRSTFRCSFIPEQESLIASAEPTPPLNVEALLLASSSKDPPNTSGLESFPKESDESVDPCSVLQYHAKSSEVKIEALEPGVSRKLPHHPVLTAIPRPNRPPTIPAKCDGTLARESSFARNNSKPRALSTPRKPQLQQQQHEEGPCQDHPPLHNQHFLHGLKLNDSRYNVMDIPSPPSPSLYDQLKRRRRFSLSSATTSSRPLRDLTDDPEFEKYRNINNSKSTKTVRLKLSHENENYGQTHLSYPMKQSCGRTLRHIESPIVESVSNAIMSTTLNTYQSISEISFHTPALVDTMVDDENKEEFLIGQHPQGSNRDHSKVDQRGEDTISTNVISSCGTLGDVGLVENETKGIAVSSSSSGDESSIEAPQLSFNKGLSQSLAGTIACEQNSEIIKRRQSSIGIRADKSSSKQICKKKKKRHSMNSPAELLQMHPSTPKLSKQYHSDHALVESQSDLLPRLFPKLPESDVNQIAPILAEARKLIHSYTLSADQSLLNGLPPTNQNPLFEQIKNLTGYVISPPVSEDQMNLTEHSNAENHSILNTRLELWNRLGPALKQTDKFKNETAAAVEEVTRTRIERQGGTYRYFNLCDKKGKKPIDPNVFQARYSAMLEEVSIIRSQCWNDYFTGLETFSNAAIALKNEAAIAETSMTKPSIPLAFDDSDDCHEGNRMDGPSADTSTDNFSMLHNGEDTLCNFTSKDAVHASTRNDIDEGDCASSEVTIVDSDNIERKSFADSQVDESGQKYDYDPSLMRSPLSWDAQAYRAAGNRCCDKEAEFVVRSASNDLPKFEPDPSEIEIISSSKKSVHGDCDHIEELLLPLPCRDEPSADPDEALAELQLWRELDNALDRYSRTIVEIKKRKAAAPSVDVEAKKQKAV
jgi:hypothetical protein